MLSTLAPEWDLHFHISTKHNKQSKGASHVQAQVSIGGHRARQVALIGQQRCLLDKGTVCGVFSPPLQLPLRSSLLFDIWFQFYKSYCLCLYCFFEPHVMHFFLFHCISYELFMFGFWHSVKHFELCFMYKSSDLNKVIILSVCLMMISESRK